MSVSKACQTLFSQPTELRIEPPLNNRNEILDLIFAIRVVMTVTAIVPSQSTMRGLRKAVGIDVNARNDIVQGHDNVGANVVLVLDGIFGSQQHCFLVLVRIGEFDPLFGDVGELDETHHLKASAVREEIVIAGALKVVETSKVPNKFGTRLNGEMIRVGEDDRALEAWILGQFNKRDCLQAAFRTDWHEDWRWNAFGILLTHRGFQIHTASPSATRYRMNPVAQSWGIVRKDRWSVDWRQLKRNVRIRYILVPRDGL